MNIQHSARDDSWGTPREIAEKVRQVLGHIDLDPASSEEANKVIQADNIWTRADNGLALPWAGTVYLNPPGGKVGNRSVAAMFWARLMEHRRQGIIRHAIFAAFSVEQLATCQGAPGESMLDFPICVPRHRVKWTDPRGAGRTAPSHSNVFVYVPGTIDCTSAFETVFGPLGKVKR